jgi:hypothetical protein
MKGCFSARVISAAHKSSRNKLSDEEMKGMNSFSIIGLTRAYKKLIRKTLHTLHPFISSHRKRAFLAAIVSADGQLTGELIAGSSRQSCQITLSSEAQHG